MISRISQSPIFMIAAPFFNFYAQSNQKSISPFDKAIVSSSNTKSSKPINIQPSVISLPSSIIQIISWEVISTMIYETGNVREER